MATRKPLVIIDGQTQELPTTDTLDGVNNSPSTVVALVANFSMLDGELYVKHLSSMIPSIVDGEFIVTLETL